MKFSYLVVAFFIVFAWFSCTEETAITDSTTNFQTVVDTIITFDPVTYEEHITTITYNLSADGKDTLEQIIRELGSNSLKETIHIVKDEKTGAIDTIVVMETVK
ncbi:MAG: hypothetical protein AAGG68_28065 [Bacteroidota bacterium]